VTEAEECRERHGPCRPWVSLITGAVSEQLIEVRSPSGAPPLEDSSPKLPLAVNAKDDFHSRLRAVQEYCSPAMV